MLRTRYLTLLLIALILPLAACGNDDESPTENDDPLVALVGTWTTQSFTYTADSDPSVTFDLNTVGLGIQTLTVSADGSFTGVIVLPDSQGQPQTIPLSGSLTSVTQSSLTINFTGAAAAALTNPLNVSYTLSGGVLTFEAADVTFDFTLQGNTPIPANLRVVLVKS